jgi:DNA-directed RNA polymerase specialized sigma subunit
MRIDVQKEVSEFVVAKKNKERKIVKQKEEVLVKVASKILDYKIPSFISRNSSSRIADYLSMDRDDIKQECLWLLHISLNTYDPSKNVKFLSYYMFNIRRHILKFALKVETMTNEGMYNKVSIYEKLSPDGEATVADLLVQENTVVDDLLRSELIERILSSLNDEQRKVVTDALYGISDSGSRFTYNDLSKKHKKSKASICKMMVKIIAKARRLFGIS